MINKLAKQIHANAKAKGFYKGKKNTGEMLALIHSEVSEALEADREKKRSPAKEAKFHISEFKDKEPGMAFKSYFVTHIKNTFEDELADIVIRVMDLAAYKKIDLEAHIIAKMKYNTTREKKHGKAY